MYYAREIHDDIVAQFSPVLEQLHVPKGTLLQVEGRICDTLYLVNYGVLRAFYHKDGKDVTAHFAFARDAITAPDSFIQAKPSRYNIEALQDSRIFAVRSAELDRFLDRQPHLEKLARQFTQAIYLELLERLEGIMFQTAKERYDKLLFRNPELTQHVNLGHVASYLGITQETLSRIRAK